MTLPLLEIKAVWMEPHRATIAVRTEGSVPIRDAVGAIGEALKLLVGAGTKPYSTGPPGADLDAILPTKMKADVPYRPGRRA